MTKVADPFYKTAKWERKRQKILRRDKYICQYSKRFGRIVEADTVHHIFPRERFPQYQFADWNLISLSHEAHNKMHDRDTHELTATGKDLMERTARARRIKSADGNDSLYQNYSPITRGEEIIIPEKTISKILVCGYPGSGKTTYTLNHLGDGVAFDLDAIAGAFRLRGPHEEDHQPSRHMANGLLRGFALNAGHYTDTVYIIRTAPSIEELEDINPDRVVMLLTRHVYRPCANDIDNRLHDVADWCEQTGTEIRIIGADSPPPN